MTNAAIKALTPTAAHTDMVRLYNRADVALADYASRGALLPATPAMTYRPIDKVRAELALCEQGYAGGAPRARMIRRQLRRLAV